MSLKKYIFRTEEKDGWWEKVMFFKNDERAKEIFEYFIKVCKLNAPQYLEGFLLKSDRTQITSRRT